MKIQLILMILLLAVAVPAMADDAGGDIYYDQPVIGVLFSHATHVDDAGLDCESCHDDLFEMAAKTVQEQPDFNMMALSQGRYCGACHDGDMAFASNTRCAVCHVGAIGYRRAHGQQVGAAEH